MLRIIVVALAAAALAACSSLLPRGKSVTQQSWRDYDSARAAIDAIVPMHTTRTELALAGIDPRTNAAVAILNVSDIMQRFTTGSAITLENLDLGVRRCLTAGKACTGYSLVLRRSDRNRVGNFWLDLLNFHRDTDITGWSFNALVLFVDDTVVYTLWGGQPRVHDREVSTNPLGPLQGIGAQVMPKF